MVPSRQHVKYLVVGTCYLREYVSSNDWALRQNEETTTEKLK